MAQFGYYNTNVDWDIVGPFLLLAVALIMLVLFKRDPLYTQKAMEVGAGLFIVAIILNVIGLTVISDGFTVFAFVIITIASIRLFWSDTNKIK